MALSEACCARAQHAPGNLSRVRPIQNTKQLCRTAIRLPADWQVFDNHRTKYCTYHYKNHADNTYKRCKIAMNGVPEVPVSTII